MRKIIADDKNVKLLGRTWLRGDTLWMALSGTGAAFRYTGRHLVMTILGGPVALDPGQKNEHARIAFYVNGERLIEDVIVTAEKSYTVFESETEETVEVRLIKLSESAMSVIGLKAMEVADSDLIEPVEPRAHRIEFIGDSITCGYGVDDMDLTHEFSTATEDVTKAYAYRTAEALNADYSMFSASGYGIISGYTGDPEKREEQQLIPPYYESMGFSRDAFGEAGSPTDIPWDFSKYTPEAVVINLGTNDDSYCLDMEERQEWYAREYAAFLETVRSHYPAAEIFCAYGIMGDRLYAYVCKAVELFRQRTGDERVHTVYLTPQNDSDGYVVNYHPVAAVHARAAGEMAAAIRETMGWT